MPKYARKYSRKFSKRRGRGRARRGGRRGSSFPKRVMAVVRSTRETKLARSQGDFDLGINVNGPDSLGSGDIHKFFPDINQGVSNNMRIGKEITATKFRIKFWAQFVPNSVGVVSPDQGNVTGRIWMMKQKNIASDHTVANNNSLVSTPYFDASKLLNAPSGVAPFTAANTYNNIMSPLNTELFTSKMEKKMNLKSLVFANAGAMDVTATVEAPSNFKKWSTVFNWRDGKKFKYVNGTAIQPQAWPWFVTGGLANTNGSVPTSGRLKVFWSSTLTYTDA